MAIKQQRMRFYFEKTASSPHVFKVIVSVASLALLLRKKFFVRPDFMYTMNNYAYL